jgi:DNA ligase-1
MMMRIKELPTLYGKSSKGIIKQWNIRVVVQGDEHVYLETVHGQLDGKKTTSSRKVTGKNIGKVNETTPFDQACMDALSKWKKKQDSNYATSIDEIPENRLPMLAHPYKKYEHKVNRYWLAQAKLNGVRCLAEKTDEYTIIFTSRKGKQFTTLDHLVPNLLEVMRVGEIFDGELYVHGWTFQQIIRRVKKKREDSHKLKYHIYDIADNTRNFIYRYAHLWNALLYTRTNLELVDVTMVFDEEFMFKLHDSYVKEGYEGLILRNPDGLYKFDHRSQDLLKYKEFEDAEYPIVGFFQGEGTEEGCIVFVCDYGKDLFNVRPRGSFEQRKEWFKKGESFIGKELTVRYQELSEDDCPIFPVGIAVRDYE